MNDSEGNKTDRITGLPETLRFGMWSARANVVLFIVYDLIVITGIILGNGILEEPFLAIAEIITLIGAPLLMFLIVTIHICAPPGVKVFSLTAVGWMLLLAGSTMVVHFVNLTLWRQLDLQQKNDLARFLGWEWPSLFFSIELLAWHLFFGLALFFAGFAFKRSGKERVVRIGLLITGILCIIGLIGPAIGDLYWRLIGVFGYGILFPIICVHIAKVFRDALLSAESEVRV